MNEQTVTSEASEEHRAAMAEQYRRGAELDAELDEVAGFLNAQTGRLVAIARRMLAEPQYWSGVGLESAPKYLAWRVGLSLGHAQRIVAIAERADELPVTIAALESGELSEDQVWPIVKRAPWWADEQSAKYARLMTVAQLQRTMRQYPFETHDVASSESEVVGADHGDGNGDDCGAQAVDETNGHDAGAEGVGTEGAGSDDADSSCGSPSDLADSDSGAPADLESSGAAPQPADVCWYGMTDDGRWRLHIETDLAAGMLIEAVLDERRDRIFQETGEPASGVEALLALADQSVDHAPPQRRERSRVLSFIDIDAQLGSDRAHDSAANGGASPELALVDRLGQLLPRHVAEQLCCDGVINPVFVANGTPLSVGRSMRIVPERTRRVIEFRDGGCRAPGCSAKHHLEIHHIIHWSDGGPTDTWNLVTLCPYHHRLHHRGRLGISGNADDRGGLSFTDARGRPLVASGTTPRLPTGSPPPISGTWEHPLGERLELGWLTFDDRHARAEQRRHAG